MNKQIVLILLLFALLIFSCKEKKQTVNQDVPKLSDPILTDSTRRTSITFIPGEADELAQNPYYVLANHYYRLNPQDKTDKVVDSLATMLEVRDYLEENPPSNGLPWGLINIVSHGNEFVDLRMRIVPKGPRTSLRSLMQAINDNIFNPVDPTLIDSASVIYLHGCGVGNNSELLNALSIAFGGKANPVQVKASKLFEYYGYTSNNQNPQSIRHYFAKVWYAFYNPDSIPDEDALIRQLEQHYPNDTVHWQEAIRRSVQSNSTQLYHTIINVPLLWDDLYEKKEKRPILNSPEKQALWLKRQKGFYQLMQQTNVPPEYFNIQYLNIELKAPNGKTYYSIRAKAMAEVMCIVQPLIASNQAADKQFEPFSPDLLDPEFFGFANPSEK